MSTTTYNTDTEISIQISTEFFAANQTVADSIALAFITNLLGNAGADLTSITDQDSTVLSGQDISGSNFSYTWSLNVKQGDSGAGSPQYVNVNAATALDALAALQENAQRMTQKNTTPLKVNYLKAAP